MSKITNRTENILVQNLAGETMIYDLLINKAYVLNETLAFVWKSCDGTKSVEDIRANAAAKFGNEVPKEFVYLSLKQLDEHNLLKNIAPTLDLTTMSRRSLVRKVGLATAIALPMISSLVAPEAANAASTGACIPFDDPCTPTDTCCTIGIPVFCVGICSA